MIKDVFIPRLDRPYKVGEIITVACLPKHTTVIRLEPDSLGNIQLTVEIPDDGEDVKIP